jgi:hypothetical protein
MVQAGAQGWKLDGYFKSIFICFVLLTTIPVAGPSSAIHAVQVEDGKDKDKEK